MTNFEDKRANNLAILETNGYNLIFSFDCPKNLEKSFIYVKIEFITKLENTQNICVKSEKFAIRFSDLVNLLNYLKNHMKALENNPDRESYVFVDYSLAYQLQALCGFVSSNNKESYFSILSMINMGKNSTSKDSVYIGGESIISFDRVEKFINSIESVISFIATEE